MEIEIEEKISEALKELLQEIKQDKVQMFDCRDIVGDYKECILQEGEVTILYAPGYNYVEVLGLSTEDYNKIYERFGY